MSERDSSRSTPWPPHPLHDCYLSYICWHVLQSSFKWFKPRVIPFPLRGCYAAKWGCFSWRRNFSWRCLVQGRHQCPLWGCAAHTLLLLQDESEELGHTERIGVCVRAPCECLSPGCRPQKAQMRPSMHGACRDRVETDFTLPPACCDSPLPHSEGVNVSPARCLHLHPSPLKQCLILPQSNLFPSKASLAICVGRGPVLSMLPPMLLQYL